MSRRVSFSDPDSDFYFKHTAAFTCATTEIAGKKKSATLKIWIFKIHKTTRFSPASFFRQIGAKVVGALTTQRRCSRKVSSSASLVRTRSYAETTLDSQRAEAIEDCIEFLNSSSLQRSNSVASSC